MTTLPAIRLRTLEPEDLDLLYQIENERSLWHVSSSNVPYSRYALRNFIANTGNDIFADRQLRQIVEDDLGKAVGIVDLVNFDPRNQRAEVGIIIAKDRQQQGYGTQTLEALIDYCREMLQLHQLYAYVPCFNKASHQLFLKAGFVEQNRLKDWLLHNNQFVDAWLMQYFL